MIRKDVLISLAHVFLLPFLFFVKSKFCACTTNSHKDRINGTENTFSHENLKVVAINREQLFKPTGRYEKLEGLLHLNWQKV